MRPVLVDELVVNIKEQKRMDVELDVSQLDDQSPRSIADSSLTTWRPPPQISIRHPFSQVFLNDFMARNHGLRCASANRTWLGRRRGMAPPPTPP